MRFSELVQKVGELIPKGTYWSVGVEYNGFQHTRHEMRWSVYDEIRGHHYGATPEEAFNKAFPPDYAATHGATLVDADTTPTGGESARVDVI